MTREEIQTKVLELSDSHNNILLSWATGVGKTYASIRLQEYMKAKKTIILVAEVAHIKNWEEEYKKHGKEKLLKTTNILCYASASKIVETDTDLLILDEGHHATSDIRMDHLSSVKAKKVIVLSATLSTEKKNALVDTFDEFEEFNIPVRKAIEWGIIPQPRIYVWELELDDSKKDSIIVINRGLTAKRVSISCSYEERWTYLKDKTKYPDLSLNVKCTQSQALLHYDEQFEYFKKLYFRLKHEFIKNKWLQTGTARKKFLAECKTSYAKQLLKKLSNKRYICFTGSITQANELGNNVIHSKVKDALKVIDDFNSKKLSNIIAVNMLQEGQNLTDIEVGLIIQLDGQELPFIQKSGRALRAEDPVIIILYYKDTRDEDYFNKVLEHINLEYMQIITDLSELKLEKDGNSLL